MITALWNLKKWFRFFLRWTQGFRFSFPSTRSRPSWLWIITRAAAFPSTLDLRGHWNTNKVSTNPLFSFSQRIGVIGHQSFVSVQPSEPDAVTLQVLSISHPRGVLVSRTLRLAPLGWGSEAHKRPHTPTQTPCGTFTAQILTGNAPLNSHSRLFILYVKKINSNEVVTLPPSCWRLKPQSFLKILLGWFFFTLQFKMSFSSFVRLKMTMLKTALLKFSF